MTMLVVVGAGASFDCIPEVERYAQIFEPEPNLSRVKVPVRDLRPPLAKDLFDRKPAFGQFAADYGQVRPLIWALREAGTANTLEDQLADYERKAEHHPQKLHHLMAMRFYLRDVITLCSEAMLTIEADAGLTNYVGLVSELHAWATARKEHVCVVNFNYDYLLERACEDVWMFNRRDPNDYVTDSLFSIVKPHGAVDWERPLLGESLLSAGNEPVTARLRRAQYVIERAVQSPRLGPVQFSVGPTGVRTPAVPALAPPIRHKSNFEWPDSHRQHFERLAHQVDRLLVIGWRAADRHFTELARTTFQGLALPTMIVNGGPQADSEALSVADNLGIGGTNQDHITYVWDGFTHLVASGELRDWLP